MKKLTLPLSGYLCLFAFIFLFSACSKTGPKGATGPAGPAGPQGASGAQGVAGPTGSQILNGTSAPGATLGNVGDFYIDFQTDSLYGPKTPSGWGTAISLIGTPGAAGAQGAQGARGDTGAQILSDTVPPLSSMGNLGDFYFDRTNDSLYGPKNSNGWTFGVSLRGSQGPAGSANVIYYNWTAFLSTSWGALNNDLHDRPYAPINMPAITAAIFNQGVVLTYIEFYSTSGSDTLTLKMDQAPTTLYNAFNGNVKETLTAEAAVGSLSFFLSDALDNNNPGLLTTQTDASSSLGYLYRIIIIPGGVQGTDVDPRKLTYQEVCNKYGIQP